MEDTEDELRLWLEALDRDEIAVLKNLVLEREYDIAALESIAEWENFDFAGCEMTHPDIYEWWIDQQYLGDDHDSPCMATSPVKAQKATRQVCTKFREGQVRCNDPNCRKLHITPRKDCQNASYLKTGICSNWSQCHSRHPWDEKWGDKDAAYQRFLGAKKTYKSQ